MSAQDPHHRQPKRIILESVHAALVPSGGLQPTHDNHFKDTVMSTRHLHPFQARNPVHPSITFEADYQPSARLSPRLVHRHRVPVAAFMIVRLGLRLLRAVALLRGVGRGSIGGIGWMSMLLLPPQVLLIRMSDRCRRHVWCWEGADAELWWERGV